MMKILAIIILFAVSVEATVESKLIYWGGITEQQKGEEAGRIRGGDFRFLASLHIQGKQNLAFFSTGSGGLIAESWVITAKHVVRSYLENPAAFSFKVTFPDGTVRQVTEAIAHPERDVAVIKLDQKVDHIPIPSLQEETIPTRLGKDGFAMTITGANGSFIAYDVIGYSEGVRLFSPDILRSGDSGAPVIGRNAVGDPIILGTLIGPHTFEKMSYAQFAQTGEARDWIKVRISSGSVIKWKNLREQKLPAMPASIYRGTPEFQLNQAMYLYLGGRRDEARQIILELIPKLKGRIYEKTAKDLLERCEAGRGVDEKKLRR